MHFDGCVNRYHTQFRGIFPVLLTRTLEQGPGQGQGLESEGQAPRQ